MKLNWNFLGEHGVQTKKPSVGEICRLDIFGNCTLMLKAVIAQGVLLLDRHCVFVCEVSALHSW